MGLDTVELIMEIEDAFDVLIPDEDAERAGTVGGLLDLVTRLVRADGRDTPRADIRVELVRVIADSAGVSPGTLRDHTSIIDDLGLD